MRYSEQFMEHIEYAFHTFCKIVLCHEAYNGELNVKNQKGKAQSRRKRLSQEIFVKLQE